MSETLLFKRPLDKNSQLTYLNVVAVCPISVISIRSLIAVDNFGLGFGVFIGSVAHGPSSIV